MPRLPGVQLTLFELSNIGVESQRTVNIIEV